MIDFARMSDSEIIASAIIAGVARWEPFSHTSARGEICFKGLRHCVSLDTNLLPTLDEYAFDRLVMAMEDHARTAGLY